MLRPQFQRLLTRPYQAHRIRGVTCRCFTDETRGNPADKTVRGTELSKQAEPGVYPDRDFVPEGGIGHVREQPPPTEDERRTIQENMAESKRLQEKWMRSIGADETGYRDPDPTSGINTAGTVTGTVDEFVSKDKPRSMRGYGQDPDDRRAKEELAQQEGYKPSQADAPYKSPFQVFDMDESTPKSAGYEKMARPTPEASKNSAIRMIKEAINTMMHGVNNAGQPEIEQKLKEIDDLEGRRKK